MGQCAGSRLSVVLSSWGPRAMRILSHLFDLIVLASLYIRVVDKLESVSLRPKRNK